MNYEFSVTFRDDHVEAHSIGEKSYQTSVTLWAEIVRVCNEHDCYRVLGVAESKNSFPTMAAMDHEKLFKDFAITRRYKIAWVELNPQAVASIKFLETVLLNRGLLNGRLFSTVEAAKKWLLAD